MLNYNYIIKKVDEMEKYNSVDDFLTAIVLNFDSNEITDKIISKIGLIRSDDKRSKL